MSRAVGGHSTPSPGPVPTGRDARSRSLRLRLTAVYTILFLLGGAALLAATYLLVEHATGNQITYVSPDGQVTVTLTRGAGEGDGLGAPGPSARSEPESSTDTDADSTGGGSDSAETGGGGPPAPPESAEELQALALQQHSDAMRQLLLQGGLALGLLTVGAAVLGWYLAGTMLRPLRTITGTVQEITASNLHRRLALKGRRDELTELGDTFDSLLDRLEASFEAQRQFVANASHELRTPLARQRAIGQVVLADPQASTEQLRAAHEKILAAGREQERLIEALLDLARGQAAVERRAPADLSALVLKALDAHGLDPHGHVVTERGEAGRGRVVGRVRLRLEPAVVTGDPRLVERLVLNLVGNAFQHAPEDSPIDISTFVRGPHAVLAVSNSGPALTEDDLTVLVQPFRRGAGERTASDRGLGLGLTVVQAVARAHDADLGLVPRAGGGLRVTVAFPVARSGSPAGRDRLSGVGERPRQDSNLQPTD